MKIILPDLKSKELFQYLRDNKQDIRKQKKIGQKNGPNIGFGSDSDIKIAQSKAIKIHEESSSSLIVENIANMAGWHDYDDDVIIKGAYNKTIADKKNNRPSLKNHILSTDAIIGDTLEVFTKEVSMFDMGIKTDISTAEAFIFKTRIRKEYDSSTYYKYLYGAIKEHSIGLFYKNLELAINDPDFEEEFKTWNKFYSQIINKERTDSRGYFWAVREIDVYENSAVVFGSNELTPTISTEEEKQFAGIATDDKYKDTLKEVEEAVQECTSKENILNYFKSL